MMINRFRLLAKNFTIFLVWYVYINDDNDNNINYHHCKLINVIVVFDNIIIIIINRQDTVAIMCIVIETFGQ